MTTYTIPNFSQGFGLELANKSMESFLEETLKNRQQILDSYIQAWLACNLPEQPPTTETYAKWVLDNCELVIKHKSFDETVYFMRVKE